MKLNFFIVILKFLFISCIRISFNDFFTSAVTTAVSQNNTIREIFNLRDSKLEPFQKKLEITGINVHGNHQRGIPSPFRIQRLIPNRHLRQIYADGLIAAFIVHDPGDLDFNEDLTADLYHKELKWYHFPSSELAPKKYRIIISSSIEAMEVMEVDEFLTQNSLQKIIISADSVPSNRDVLIILSIVLKKIL
ncbi:hypothetical protein C1645_766378 [Glomus cerebriforme]|uniref:Uncharacterized protein n=1 Tax=Glomus cerebriforme TaxID=658196 RepID=A0A397T0M8_9GLOM|nr:hypothetical protein C1645_766378 [Glomus cerebriforme]